MTARERMMAAIRPSRGRLPDRVPAAPDISNMVPCRLTGRPFWDIYMHGDPPLWRAYIDAADHLGIDGWFTYGRLEWEFEEHFETTAETLSETEDRIVRRSTTRTPHGNAVRETTYFVADPPSATLKPITDIAAQFELWSALNPEPVGFSGELLDEQREALGEKGVLGVGVGVPGFQSWFYDVEGGVEALTYAWMDHPELLERMRELQHRRFVKMAEMVCRAKPDFILTGGSGSLTLQSPELFRKYSLPTLKEVCRIAAEAGVATMVHSCGRERELVKICAEETGLDCINPLEIAPMGDCDLGEIKREFGGRIALMGNLHTTEVMLKGSREDVLDASRAALEAAKEGGGFILSTGDQCGRDTPDENIRAMVEACERWGNYE